MPMTHRFVFAVGFAGLSALSFVSSLVRKHLAVLVYALGCAAVLHVLFMGTQGDFGAGAIVALLLVIPLMNSLFYPWPYLFHANLLLLSVIVFAYANSSPDFLPLFLFILSSLVIGGISFWFTRRLRIREIELKREQERLEVFFSQALSGAFFMMFDEPIEWDDQTNKEEILDYVFCYLRMTRVNQAMLDQYRTDEAGLLGRTAYDFFKHDLEHGHQVLSQLFDRGHLQVETRERRLDQTPIVVEGDYICLYDSQGRITGFFGVQQDVTQRKEAEEKRQHDLRFQKLIAQASADLVRVTNDIEFTAAIEQTLERLGEMFQADRGYLFQFTDDLENMSNTHEWCADEIESQKERIQGYPTNALPWWKKHIVEFGPVQILDVDKLPPEAEREKREFSSQGICSLICIPTRGAHGQLLGFVGFDMVKQRFCWTDEQILMLQILADTIGGVLERRRAEEALQESEERHRISFEQSRDAIMILAPPDWHFTLGNLAAIELFGARDNHDFATLTPWDVSPRRQIDGELSATKAQEMISIAMRNGSHFFEWTHRRLDGVEFLATVMLSRMQLDGREYLQALVRDITESKQAEEEIRFMSFHDSLTGLYNRRFFEEELERLDTQRNLPLTLMMLDVNGLKLTNDAFGHGAGDELLKKVASVLASVCREDEIVARIGGDEFVALLPKTDHEGAAQIRARVSSALMGQFVEALPVSVSFGIATKVDVKEDVASIRQMAEDQMYRHKLSERSSRRHESIELFVRTLHEKSPREQRHSVGVSELCVAIGKAMGISSSEVDALRTVGLLHDIGKIGISDHILNKKLPLTEDEMTEMMRHPEIGYSILSSVNDYAPLAETIVAHHEHWDGTGYPSGLAGGEIPLFARILAVADAYDGMRSHATSEKVQFDEILREFEACSGRQFDPDIVALFLKMVRSEDSPLLDSIVMATGSE